GQRLGQPPGPGVVVGQPVDHLGQGDDAGGGDHPRLAHAAAEPGPLLPAGGERPLDRQNITVSTGAASTGAPTPRATAALNSRAPSQCTGSPCRRAAAATASTRAGGHGTPPAGMCVFSMATSDSGGRWWAGPWQAASTASASNVPSRSWSGRTWTPALRAAAAAS